MRRSVPFDSLHRSFLGSFEAVAARVLGALITVAIGGAALLLVARPATAVPCEGPPTSVERLQQVAALVAAWDGKNPGARHLAVKAINPDKGAVWAPRETATSMRSAQADLPMAGRIKTTADARARVVASMNEVSRQVKDSAVRGRAAAIARFAHDERHREQALRLSAFIDIGTGRTGPRRRLRHRHHGRGAREGGRRLRDQGWTRSDRDAGHGGDADPAGRDTRVRDEGGVGRRRRGRIREHADDGAAAHARRRHARVRSGAPLRRRFSRIRRARTSARGSAAVGEPDHRGEQAARRTGRRRAGSGGDRPRAPEGARGVLGGGGRRRAGSGRSRAERTRDTDGHLHRHGRASPARGDRGSGHRRRQSHSTEPAAAPKSPDTAAAPSGGGYRAFDTISYVLPFGIPFPTVGVPCGSGLGFVEQGIEYRIRDAGPEQAVLGRRPAGQEAWSKLRMW